MPRRIFFLTQQRPVKSMMKCNLYFAQGIYYILAGIWPIIDISSFLQITGPKTDIWLVKMVALLSISIGLTFLFLARNKIYPLILNASTALSYLIIDVYYSYTGVISKIYLADAVVELLILIWIVILLRRPPN
jgi:hypothetical protein